MIKLLPPGTFCTIFGLVDLIKKKPKDLYFLEVGCGEGIYSRHLLNQGAKGVGIDFSPQALEVANKNLEHWVNSGQYKITEGDFIQHDMSTLGQFDLIFSVMVLEHVEDESKFLNRINQLLKNDGIAVVIVPSNPSAWGVEDDLAGHLRRYTKTTLTDVCISNGFKKIDCISIGVPVVNLLLGISNFLVKRYDSAKKTLSEEEKTKSSGTRDIPYKTIFPTYFKYILNERTLFPLKILQRLFYRSNMGLITGISLKKSF